MGIRQSLHIRERLAGEKGTPSPAGDLEMALVYPGPYSHGMASLGFLWIQRLVNSHPDWAAHRAFLPDRFPDEEPLTYETRRPVSEFGVIAFSVGYERDLLAMARILRAARISPCRSERTRHHDPLIIAGGPITYAQPRLLGELADIVFVGEAEKSLGRFLDLVAQGADPMQAASMSGPGVWTPGVSEVPDAPGSEKYNNINGLGSVRIMPGTGGITDGIPLSREELPAFAPVTSPESEFGERMLMEVVRGCSRPCGFCVMSRLARGVGMRIVDVPTLMDTAALSPVRSVGLVGAGLGDYPYIRELLESLVREGYTFSLSSLRPTHLDEDMAAILQAGGVRTITVAADGLSERLRRWAGKQIDAQALTDAARLAGRHMMKVKLYQIIGYPGETDDDVEEFTRLARTLASHARVTVTLSPFVPKPSTPFADEEAPSRKRIRTLVSRLKKALRGVQVQPVSWREARLEYLMDRHPDEASALICSGRVTDASGLLARLEEAHRQAGGT